MIQDIWNFLKGATRALGLYLGSWLVRTVDALKKVLLRPVPHYTRWGFYLQAMTVLSCLVCFQLWPLIPTVAIGVLGVVAVIMTVRADHFSHTERVVWVVISFALFIIEMKAVYKDRDDHEAEQTASRARESEARKAEQDSFAALLSEGRSLFAQGNSVIELSKRNLDTITGGDSFCYVTLSMERNALPVYLIHQGINHIFDVRITIIDLDKFDGALRNGKLNEPAGYEEHFGPIPTLQRGTLLELTKYIPPQAEAEKRYNVSMMARNGAFTQLIRIRRGPGQVWQTAVIVSASYYDGRRGVVYKEIRGFPMDVLKKDKDWMGMEKVPRLDVPK